MDAARDAAEIDPRAAYQLVGEAAKAGGFSGNQAWLTAAGDLALSFPEPDDDASRIIRRAVIGIGKLMGGDPAGALAEIRDVLAAAELTDDPELMEYGIAAAWLMGDEALSSQLLARAERTARERTMIGILPIFLAAALRGRLRRRAPRRCRRGRRRGRAPRTRGRADDDPRRQPRPLSPCVRGARRCHALRDRRERGERTRRRVRARPGRVDRRPRRSTARHRHGPLRGRQRRARPRHSPRTRGTPSERCL